MPTEQIWFKDPQHFITISNYNKFFPSIDMNFTEQLNALLRLSLYFCIIVFILKRDANIFFVMVFMGLFTFLMFSVDEKNNQTTQNFLDKNNLMLDKITNQPCIKPTKDNPFMNVLMNEYVEKPQRDEACDVTQPVINNSINNAFDTGLYRDVSDVFSKMASDRQYITQPSTTIPNAREKLTNWLYKTGPTCKESNGDACYQLQYSPIENM